MNQLLEKGLEQSRAMDCLCKRLKALEQCPPDKDRVECGGYRYINECLTCWREWAYQELNTEKGASKMATETIRAYHRDAAGVLTLVECYRIDGELCGPGGYPLEPTDQTAELKGWPDVGIARLYLNAGGLEILVPTGVAST